MSHIVFQKDWFAVFKIKVTVKDNIFEMCLLNMLSELLILLQLNFAWWYIIIRWIVLEKIGLLCCCPGKDWIALLLSRSRSQKRFRIPKNVHLDDISSAAEPSVTKLGLVMQHHGPKCHARRLLSSSSESQWLMAHLITYDCFYHSCWSADFFATKFNWMVHHHKLECFV